MNYVAIVVVSYCFYLPSIYYLVNVIAYEEKPIETFPAITFI